MPCPNANGNNYTKHCEFPICILAHNLGINYKNPTQKIKYVGIVFELNAKNSDRTDEVVVTWGLGLSPTFLNTKKEKKNVLLYVNLYNIIGRMLQHTRTNTRTMSQVFLRIHRHILPKLQIYNKYIYGVNKKPIAQESIALKALSILNGF